MSDADETSGPALPEEPIDKIKAPFQSFIRTETGGGGVLLLAAVTALVIANSGYGQNFDSIWQTTLGFRIGDAVWDHPLRHWINDGLVTLFFFVIGLEIKREIAHGELSNPGDAVLPIVAAVGGMVVPAGLYLALATGPQAASGWVSSWQRTLRLSSAAWRCLASAFPTAREYSCWRWQSSTTSAQYWSS